MNIESALPPPGVEQPLPAGMALTRGGTVRATAVPGLSHVALVGAAQGSVHLEARLETLQPGAAVPGHLHAFEESFFVLQGSPVLAISGTDYALRPGDFGYAPLAAPHAWANHGVEPATWLAVRAPQPRRMSTAGASYGSFVADLDPPGPGGRPVEPGDPRCRLVGHFAEQDVAPPGPVQMPGYRGGNIRNISVRLMVDDGLGAVHHTLFVIQFAPPTQPGLSAREHYHPFEEIYYILSGTADASLSGRRVPLAEGDLLWVGTNAPHGFVNTGRQPVRWIEAQAPAPPRAEAFLFDHDWADLEPFEEG